MAMNLKKDLQAVNKELNTLSKKVEKMIAAVEKLDKPKTAAAKPAKKAPVKKAAVTKIPEKASAIDTILGIIKRSRKGVSAATLKDKTGIQANVIHNTVYRLKKQGKIKSGGKGVYVKA